MCVSFLSLQGIHAPIYKKKTGNWALQHAPELQWSDGDRWHVSIDLPANGVYEYKYVILSADGQHAISWQRGNNCVLAIKPDDDRVEVYDNWYVYVYMSRVVCLRFVCW